MPRDRDYDDRPRRSDKESRREEPAPRRGGPKLNEFFVDGQGIHREVLQREICRFLGPEAHSRPSTYNGVRGYTITAVRPFTPKMLDDLMDLSEAFIAENREMARRGHQGVPYEEFRIRLGQDGGMRSGSSIQDSYGKDPYGGKDPYKMESYPPAPSYSSATAQSGYNTLSPTGYPPGQPLGYTGSIYPPDTEYPSSGNYAPGYSTGSTQPVYGERDRYPYPGNESPRSMEGPGRPTTTYSNPGSSRPGRIDPRQDPRDPRQDPRDLRADPRDARYGAPESRARVDPRDPRAGPRVDPRSAAAYPSYAGSPDVPMSDYDYVSAMPPSGSGRNVSGYPASTGYDPRDMSQMREYRPEPLREEPRRTRR